MLTRLIKHGHSHAIVIDKSLLKAAGLKEDAFFLLTVNPNGGLLIQSLDDIDNDQFEKQCTELSSELFELMKNLSKK